jgi:hypothetical protein
MKKIFLRSRSFRLPRPTVGLCAVFVFQITNALAASDADTRTPWFQPSPTPFNPPLIFEHIPETSLPWPLTAIPGVDHNWEINPSPTPTPKDKTNLPWIMEPWILEPPSKTTLPETTPWWQGYTHAPTQMSLPDTGLQQILGSKFPFSLESPPNGIPTPTSTPTPKAEPTKTSPSTIPNAADQQHQGPQATEIPNEKLRKAIEDDAILKLQAIRTALIL